jgi:hypothetical protein
LCRQLNPKEVWELEISHNDLKESKLNESKVELIFNNVFVITVNGHNILVVAGCPTELSIRISIIIEICEILCVRISFAIVAKRFFERKDGFNTLEELSSAGTFIHEEMISKIDNSSFQECEIWKERIARLKLIILENI